MLSSRFSHVQFFATLWTVVRQAPLSMGFSRQEYWSGLPCPLPESFHHRDQTRISYALEGGFFTTDITWETPILVHGNVIFITWVKRAILPIATNRCSFHGVDLHVSSVT